MLEIGTNTYCTLEDADSIVAQIYPFGDNQAYWGALSDDKKEQLLINSAKEMENLPVAGVKLFYNQPLQFPRKANFYRYNEIPSEVKEAQVANAVDMMLVGIGTKQPDGKILTSLLAENKLKRWTCGGFKMGGFTR